MLLSCNIFYIIKAESATNLYWSISVTNYYYSAPIVITSTNLVVKWPSEQWRFRISYDRWDYSINTYEFSPKPNDDVFITTNRLTRLYHGEADIGYDFIPVSFTSGLIGFKVHHSYPTKWGYSSPVAFTNHTYYVALSDTLVEVGEADVERELLAEDDD